METLKTSSQVLGKFQGDQGSTDHLVSFLITDTRGFVSGKRYFRLLESVERIILENSGLPKPSEVESGLLPLTTWPILSGRLETLKSSHGPTLLCCLETHPFCLHDKTALLHLPKLSNYFLPDMETKFYCPGVRARTVEEPSENVVHVLREEEDGLRGNPAWAHTLCVFFVNVGHSESALITKGTITALCRRALILLTTPLCGVII